MANTLEKMQAEGLYEDEGLTTQESEQSLETETLEESEAVVAEESNEAEVVLVGDEQALPNQSERENHAWGSLRRNNRSLKRENREKDEEIARLNERLARVEEVAIKPPKLEDFDSEEQYQQATRDFYKPKQHQEPVKPQAEVRNYDDVVNSHYERAEKAGLNLTKFASSEKAVRARFGDQATDILIDQLGDESHKIIQHVGSSESNLDTVHNLLMQDPSGVKLTMYMGRLAERLQVEKKAISKAPKPTRTPSGGATGASDLQRRFDSAAQKKDANEMFKIRREARKAGVNLE